MRCVLPIRFVFRRLYCDHANLRTVKKCCDLVTSLFSSCCVCLLSSKNVVVGMEKKHVVQAVQVQPTERVVERTTILEESVV